MRPCVALLAVVLATPAIVAAQTGPTPSPTAAPPSAPPATTPPDLARIKRGLETATPLRDAALTAPSPTFRTSVTEHVDIWKFWGEDPSAVAASVRPNGGTWHQEFQNMVTPDEFKGYGGILSNGEKLQLAATSLAFAGMMKLIGIGVQQAKEGLQNRAVRQAKDEVQQELEAFYALHPEARPAAPATPP
jgi:hypothetical protein